MNNDLWEYKHDLKCLKIVGMLLNGQPTGKIIDEIQSLHLVNNPEVRYNDGSHYTKDEHSRFTGGTSSGGGAVALSSRYLNSSEQLYILWIDFEGKISIGPDEFTNSGTWVLKKPNQRK